MKINISVMPKMNILIITVSLDTMSGNIYMYLHLGHLISLSLPAGAALFSTSHTC